LERSEAEVARLRQELDRLRQRLDRTEGELELARVQVLRQGMAEKPEGSGRLGKRPLRGHQFCTSLIALSIELGKQVGFRGAARVLKLVFDAMGIEQKVPSHDAIEQWTLRLGVSSLFATFRKDQRVIWLVDHSVQIGSERVLLIVGVALEDLPGPGETLEFDKVKVLAVVPGESWKKEDVEREYRKLAERIGAPVYLVCDGDAALREAAEILERDGQKTIVLGDLKHYAANVLEKEIGRSERFRSFVGEVGLTRSRIQQTELSHFVPPPLKSKSRFMNLGPLLRWAAMVLYHLENPGSEARRGISADRMEAKLGWLREYAEEVGQWGQCLEVIHRSLDVINRQGLSRSTAALIAAALREQDGAWHQRDTAASRIGRRLIAWVEESASKLPPGDRAWCSTEILESLFGRFKQLERQHSRGGFTRLIAALPTLCLSVTPEMVREGFARLDSPGLRRWLDENLGQTLTARRNNAYHEYRRKQRNPVLALT